MFSYRALLHLICDYDVRTSDTIPSQWFRAETNHHPPSHISDWIYLLLCVFLAQVPHCRQVTQFSTENRLNRLSLWGCHGFGLDHKYDHLQRNALDLVARFSHRFGYSLRYLLLWLSHYLESYLEEREIRSTRGVRTVLRIDICSMFSSELRSWNYSVSREFQVTVRQGTPFFKVMCFKLVLKYLYFLFLQLT